ncbi:MAG: alanine racemase [Pyrinomonadaceae bacterium]
MMNEHRPTWAEIRLDNLASNFQSVKRSVGADVKYMAVVKADAYGHGATQCARRLEAEGVDWFGVALPEEGIELRQAKIGKPILCLGSFWKGQENELLNYNLTPIIFRLDAAESFNRAAQMRGTIADIHIKVDTGMNRVGVRCDELNEFAEKLKQFKNLKVDGVMTHFAAADNDDDFTNLQIERFKTCVKLLEEKGFRPTFRDLANSPGAIGYKNARGNLVRLGGVLYGLWSDILPKNIQPPPLKPVMTLHTRISLLKRVPKGETVGYSRAFKTRRDSLIATVPIGYEDGYRRGLSNVGRVIVGGVFADVVGRISMDWTLLDVTNVPNVKLDDEVILIGEQNDLRVTAEELAAQSATISYEITCGINRRVERKFIV